MTIARTISSMLIACAVALCACPAGAQLVRNELPEELQGVTVVEKLGDQIPGDLPLLTAEGERLTLGDYFNNDKPIILAMVYFDCPMVCPLVLGELQDCVNDLKYDVGTDYDVVVVSFDHTESASAAAEQKNTMLAAYDRPITDATRRGFAFHVTDELTALELSRTTGFGFRRLENDEYSHPVALLVLTPEGHVSRYVYGFDYPAKRVRIALLEASEGKIATSIGDYFLHLCFRYDPNAGVYSVHAMTVVRIGGFLTILFLVTLIGGLILHDRRRTGKRKLAGAGIPASVIATGQA